MKKYIKYNYNTSYYESTRKIMISQNTINTINIIRKYIATPEPEFEACYAKLEKTIPGIIIISGHIMHSGSSIFNHVIFLLPYVIPKERINKIVEEAYMEGLCVSIQNTTHNRRCADIGDCPSLYPNRFHNICAFSDDPMDDRYSVHKDRSIYGIMSPEDIEKIGQDFSNITEVTVIDSFLNRCSDFICSTF
jgi:hypothetical protein